ncbi:MAG: cupin domain-containing protein [Nocardioides sp.]
MDSPGSMEAGAAGFVLAADEGDAYWWLGSLSINKVRSQDAQGGLSIVDHRVPAGFSPPPHIHHGVDEAFFILDGQFAVMCGEQSWHAGPGSLVFLPRDIPHGFTVSDKGPGRTLLILSPGGFDEFVRDLGTPAPQLTLPGPDEPTPELDRFTALAAAHGISPAEPPPGPNLTRH